MCLFDCVVSCCVGLSYFVLFCGLNGWLVVCWFGLVGFVLLRFVLVACLLDCLSICVCSFVLFVWGLLIVCLLVCLCDCLFCVVLLCFVVVVGVI